MVFLDCGVSDESMVPMLRGSHLGAGIKEGVSPSLPRESLVEPLASFQGIGCRIDILLIGTVYPNLRFSACTFMK